MIAESAVRVALLSLLVGAGPDRRALHPPSSRGRSRERGYDGHREGRAMTGGATARRTLATVNPRRWLPRRGVMAAAVVVGLGITLALIWSLRGSSGTQSPATSS